MANKMMGTCPCGFTFTMLHGLDDAIAVMQYHVKLIHKKDFPNGLTREQATEDIKEAK